MLIIPYFIGAQWTQNGGVRIFGRKIIGIFCTADIVTVNICVLALLTRDSIIFL